ncbi:transcriptional regulator, XRE family [Lutibacter sp. Hel_I_33_5]|uniref:helix-turn-helix domain-containing protein n=1 Tax=Lutibacter sp. Hel_I_33_5 TaxID=1566289 RepID=UPI0011A9DE0F|nr:helix-turn-helix transcriptional regulator [Lutibacter sp. Hel_I_33_5]TVZ55078.1 transcriptional regulator, XRE family [Lutibacter sp. Hel_I_33_5]
MVNTNNNWISMNDKSIIKSIGNYIKHQRLNQNKTQGKIAKTAGVNRSTISQIENGEAISLSSLIQILRALNLLSVLDVFNVNTQPSPLELAKIEKQKRKRARDTNDNPKNESKW